jgi:ubiquitin carboxyl-terminal hydrolase 25/28
MLKEKAQKNSSELEQKIKGFEETLQQPYTQLKERPFYLHAVMIHDGMANMGHYYTYLFDRSQELWWKLDDHRVTVATEQEVMKDALGGNGHKCACNLFYIN